MVGPLARQAQVDMMVDSGKSTACAPADRLRLRQVLLKLLKDAPVEQLNDAVQTVAAGGHLPGLGHPPGPVPRDALRIIELYRQNIKRKLQLDGHASLIRYGVERAAYPESVTEGRSAQAPARTSHSWHSESGRLND